MQTAGYDRAFVDEAGNAVGEIGRARRGAHRRAARPHRHGARRHPGAHRTVRARATCCTAAAASTPRGRSPRSSPRLRVSEANGRAPDRHPRRRRRRRRGGGRHQQGRAVHRGALRRRARADARRLRHRRAESLAPRSRSATRAACCSISSRVSRWRTPPGPDAERRGRRGRSLELGDGARGGRQRRPRQGLRSAEPEPAPLHHRHDQGHDRDRRRAVCVAPAARLRLRTWRRSRHGGHASGQRPTSMRLLVPTTTSRAIASSCRFRGLEEPWRGDRQNAAGAQFSRPRSVPPIPPPSPASSSRPAPAT